VQKLQGYKKLYEEALVKEIMISTALCIQELMQEDINISEEEICLFLDENYPEIIEEALCSRDEGDSEDWKEGL
jgi:hypothetical protein